MPTATKVTKDIIEMKPTVVGQETTVTLVLTEFEAQVLREAVGSVTGAGNIRKATDAIYDSLGIADIAGSKRYFRPGTVLDINYSNPEN